MSITQGRDVRRTTIARSAGAAPTITSGSQFTTGSVRLDTLSARPSSVSFDLPIDFVIPPGEGVIFSGFLEKSANGSDWSAIEGTASEDAWSNPAASGDLTVNTALRIGGDLVQSDLLFVRAKGTMTRSDSEVTFTQRGMCVLFGCLDVTAEIPRSERQVI